MADTAHSATILEGVAALVSATAWPLVTSIFLFAYRKEVRNILAVLVDKLKNAKQIKAAGVEITVDELIDKKIEQTQSAASPQTLIAESKVPPTQVATARQLQEEVLSSGVDEKEAADTARERVRALALQYEDVRKSMPPGGNRTYEMNRIMAAMRTIALLSKPFLGILTRSSISGERLAAIAVLQVEPDAKYSAWLSERFGNEPPFVFFQAALALQQLVLHGRGFRSSSLKEEIMSALETVKNFQGGEPDPNTISVLEDALNDLDELTRK